MRNDIWAIKKSQKKDIWVEEIDKEIANAPYKRFFWGIIVLVSALVFYFLAPDVFGKNLTDLIKFILILIFVFALVKTLESQKNPDYLAYYIYKIGDEFPAFEVKTNYLNRNQNYIKNCSKQISYLINETFTQPNYFIDDILNFLNNLYKIILRLNHIYSQENINESLIAKLEGTSKETLLITEQEFISSKLKELANLIHKEHSNLTEAHVELASEILNELEEKDIPEKQIHKPLSEYPKEIWNKLPFKIKILIILVTIFVIIFIALSQILIKAGVEQQQSYTTAMLVSGGLTGVAFTKIELFVARERGR